MRIEQFTYIVDVAKSGSIAKSAKRLYATPSSMSIAIAGLEKELGVKVFERSSHGLTPTDAGTEIIAKAESVLTLVEEMKAIATVSPARLGGALVVATERANSFGPILPLVVDRVKRRFPQVELSIVAADANDMIEGLESGEIDIALLGNIEGRENASLGLGNSILNHPGNYPDYEVVPIFRTEIVVYFDKDSPFAKKKVVTKKDLLEWPVLTRSQLGESYLKAVLGEEFKPLRFVGNRRMMDYLILKKNYVSFDSIISLRLDSDFGDRIAFHSIEGVQNKLTLFAVRRKECSDALVQGFLRELKEQAELFKE